MLVQLGLCQTWSDTLKSGFLALRLMKGLPYIKLIFSLLAILSLHQCSVPDVTDAKGLTTVQEVEQLREKVYATLEEYCKSRYADEPGRFAKLLLRLPALRSIGLKCLEHLFFFKLIGDTPIDTFLMEMLETPSPTT